MTHIPHQQPFCQFIDVSTAIFSPISTMAKSARAFVP